MDRRTARWVSGCFIVGGIVYSSWFLAFIVPTGLSQRGAYTSELEAAGVPYGWLFRGCDVLAGLLLFVGAIFALRAGRTTGAAGRSWYMDLGYVAVAVIGGCTAITGFLVLDCASSNGSCRRLRRSGVAATWHNVGHHQFSNVAGAAFGVAIAAFTLAALRHQAPALIRRWVGWVLLLAIVTSGPLGTAVFAASWRGVPQRADETVEAALLILLGLSSWPQSPGIAAGNEAATAEQV